MKIALIGATGFVGSAVLPELLNRGHDVTVLARVRLVGFAPAPGTAWKFRCSLGPP